MDYAGYAALLGLKGVLVDDSDDIDAAWDEAFAADRPVVLSVKTCPNTPPLPVTYHPPPSNRPGEITAW